MYLYLGRILLTTNIFQSFNNIDLIKKEKILKLHTYNNTILLEKYLLSDTNKGCNNKCFSAKRDIQFI